MSLKTLLSLFRKPVFFLVKFKWIERNEPLMVVDMGSNLKSLLNRKGNECAEYIIIGFKVRP